MAREAIYERTVAQLDRALKAHQAMQTDLAVVYGVVNDLPVKSPIAPRLAACLLTSIQLQQALIVALVNVLTEE
jgi:hypothetical protein